MFVSQTNPGQKAGTGFSLLERELGFILRHGWHHQPRTLWSRDATATAGWSDDPLCCTQTWGCLFSCPPFCLLSSPSCVILLLLAVLSILFLCSPPLLPLIPPHSWVGRVQFPLLPPALRAHRLGWLPSPAGRESSGIQGAAYGFIHSGMLE